MRDKPDTFPTDTLLQLLNYFRPSTIRYNRRVFVNRNLRLKKIQAVGFDMDYTLAIYKLPFEQLAWTLALQRLVEEFDFPEEVLDFTYDPGFAIRGLVIDMVNGNILKMDRHRHVSVAFHGMNKLEKGPRDALYRRKRLHISRAKYFLVDTLFSLPETHMYAQTVDLLDREGRGNPKSYEHAYQCIRQAVDSIHRDGTLKAIVLKDLDRYIHKDPDIAYTLERLFYSGKKLFLATNSDWLYTKEVMAFLLDGVLDSHPNWHQYFEHIIVEARKPRFFMKREPLMAQPGAPEHLAHKVFRYGNLREFEGLLNCAGERVLYIGDHIYGDIVRSKKSSTWRTAMIIPEMERELVGVEDATEDQYKWDGLFKRRLLLEIEANYQQRLLTSLLNLEELSTIDGPDGVHPIQRVIEVSEANTARIRQSLDRTEEELATIRSAVIDRFNPHFGRLFKDGTGHSVFGEQVESWACLYTSRVSNFLSYSPIQYFRTARDLLPHERWTL